MEPLATYHESRFGGPRHYSLFPGYLTVSGRETFRSEFEVKVPLQNLYPEHSRARVRNHLFWVGLMFAAVGGLGLLQRLSSSNNFGYDDFWSLLWAALLVAGVVVSIATSRKVTHVIFVDGSGRGVVGLLESDDPQFRSFIHYLSSEIIASRNNLKP